MERKIYWNTLVALHKHINYLQLYVHKCDRLDNSINMLVAIASSASIATWAVWDKYPFVWGGIIASSQVITAIKPYFPYAERKKAAFNLYKGLSSLSIECDRTWFDIASKKLSKDQIREVAFNLQEKKNKMKEQHLKGMILPINEKLSIKAEEILQVHLNNNFYFK